MATNRIESLDPALIRPGRIDRKIEFPLPDTKTKRRIFGIHTGRMTLGEDVNLEEFVLSKVSNSIKAMPITMLQNGLLIIPACRMSECSWIYCNKNKTRIAAWLLLAVSREV